MLRRISYVTVKKIDKANKYSAITKKYNTDKIIHSIKKRRKHFFLFCMTA